MAKKKEKNMIHLKDMENIRWWKIGKFIDYEGRDAMIVKASYTFLHKHPYIIIKYAESTSQLCTWGRRYYFKMYTKKIIGAEHSFELIR